MFRTRNNKFPVETGSWNNVTAENEFVNIVQKELLEMNFITS